MKIKKSILSVAITSSLTLAISSPLKADVINMDFNGLFTWVDSNNKIIKNDSQPYYSDPTWGFGARTQISGTLQYDTISNAGSAAVNQFEWLIGGSDSTANITNFDISSVGGGLLIGNMNFNWNLNDYTTQIVLNASGLFAGIDAGLATASTIFDTSSCASGGSLHDGTDSLCAIPASNDHSIGGADLSIGPSPIVTTNFNTTGQTGAATTIGQLSLGTDDGFAGSPMDNGPFEDSSYNFDFTSIQVTSVSAVPVPAAAWLFGSGLVGLVSVARRRKHH